MNGMYTISSSHATTFTAFDDLSQIYMGRIVKILNGEDLTIKFDKKNVTIKDKTKIIITNSRGEKAIILVRGWGRLTGGNLMLPPTEAAKLQDEFIQWVIDTITEEKEEAPSCVVYMNPTAD
jgi:hypothetical protein